MAFYFAWLGFYTALLLPAALVGIGVFIYGILMVAAGDSVSYDFHFLFLYIICHFIFLSTLFYSTPDRHRYTWLFQSVPVELYYLKNESIQ